MKIQYTRIIVFILLVVVTIHSFDAQCAMCQAAAQNSQYAKKLNTGILYLLFAPVVILGSVLLFWVKNKKKFQNNPDNTNA